MNRNTVDSIWKALYGGKDGSGLILSELLDDLDQIKGKMILGQTQTFSSDGLVYCAYADAFGQGLDGVAAQLPRLAEMGVNILWLLPLLDSPGRDQGFDIRSYDTINPLFGGNSAMDRLLAAARTQGIRIIFDVAINHTSDEHPWFLDAVRSPQSPYRSYYHWAENPGGYSQTSLIFAGMVDSNWTWNEKAGAWYFHRFYPFQPDLNYANPQVARQIITALARWKAAGIDGFRMDAAALLWKEEGTDCENLPQVHLVLKLFRACLDYLSPGTLLLAEVNIPVPRLVSYFGQGDECRGAYHFALMPRFYQALREGSPERLMKAEFPDLPEGCSWFTFLRCHDEVTLDTLPADERPALVAHYGKDPEIQFRQGQAFSGRLFELMDRNPQKTLLAWSLLFSLPGTPILYYGDEIAMENNRSFFEEKSAQTGFRDSRFFHRGPFDIPRSKSAGAAPSSPEGQVWTGLKKMLDWRRTKPELFRIRPQWYAEGSLLISRRQAGGETMEMVSNLGDQSVEYRGERLEPWGFRWRLV